MSEGSQFEIKKESDPNERVAGVHTFEELYFILHEIGDVQGSAHLYPFNELRLRIEQVRHGHRDITFVTQTFGIRTKVEELLLSDSVYKKYQKQN